MVTYSPDSPLTGAAGGGVWVSTHKPSEMAMMAGPALRIYCADLCQTIIITTRGTGLRKAGNSSMNHDGVLPLILEKRLIIVDTAEPSTIPVTYRPVKASPPNQGLSLGMRKASNKA